MPVAASGGAEPGLVSRSGPIGQVVRHRAPRRPGSAGRARKDRSKKVGNDRALVADRVVVKTLEQSVPVGYVPPKGVHQVIQVLGPSLADGGASYLRLSAAIDRFLAEHELESWNQLDVAAFVRDQVGAGQAAPEVCCNFAALLPHLLRSDDLTPTEAERIWLALSGSCDNDPAALAYIELGLQTFLERERRTRRRRPSHQSIPRPPARNSFRAPRLRAQ